MSSIVQCCRALQIRFKLQKPSRLLTGIILAIIVCGILHSGTVIVIKTNGINTQTLMESLVHIPDIHPSLHYVDVNKHNSSLWIEYSKYVLVRKTAFYLNDHDKDATKPSIVINAIIYDINKIHPRLKLKIVYSNDVQSLCVPLKEWKRSGVYKHHPDLYHVTYVMKTTGDIYNTIPDHVMLAKDEYCTEGLSSAIPIYKRKNETLKQFGVCIHQPIHHKNQTEIVDWIALHQILGVEVIFIYLETRFVSSSVINAIIPFVKSGLVELIDWSINIETRNYGQLSVIQDCIYRAKSTVQYLALYDLDEVIIPRKGLTWMDMLRELQNHSEHTFDNFASWAFETYVWSADEKKIKVEETKICGNMSLPIYFNRTARVDRKPVKRREKLIIQPQLVQSSWIHNILYNKKSSRYSYHVPFDIGSVHHYQIECCDPDTVVLNDYIMKKYANATLDLIHTIMC